MPDMLKSEIERLVTLVATPLFGEGEFVVLQTDHDLTAVILDGATVTLPNEAIKADGKEYISEVLKNAKRTLSNV